MDTDLILVAVALLSALASVLDEQHQRIWAALGIAALALRLL